ncbi:MAG: hypothetical protein N2A42_12345 [Luteolibacter sp.]
MHPVSEATLDLLNPFQIPALHATFMPRRIQLPGHICHEVLPVKHRQPLEEIRIGDPSPRLGKWYQESHLNISLISFRYFTLILSFVKFPIRRLSPEG